jgi:2-dehydropantoate 2-reductase
LAETGNDVLLINHRSEQVQAIQTQGLVMCTPTGERTVRPRASVDALGQGHADLVIVLVKSFHTATAMQGATSLVGPDTVVLSLQNGLGHEDILADIVGRDHVLAGKTYVGGVMLSPGRILAGTQGKETYIGELDGRLTSRAQRIAEVFSHAGLLTHVSDNIMGTMWDKLLVNVATGALSGITRLNYGDLYKIAPVKATAIAAVQEAMDVARAHHVQLSCTQAHDAWVKAAEGLPYEFKTSMLQSLEKGSITEIDFINGAVVRWGERCDVPTPVNATLVACIKGIESTLSA